MSSIKFQPLVLALGTLAFCTQAQQTQIKNWTTENRSAKADSLPLDSLKEDKPYLTLGSEYTSQVVFWGRNFGESQFGFSPYLFLNSGKGFYGYVVNGYWSATPHKPARTTYGIGYEYSLSKHIYAFAGYEKWSNHYGDDYLNHALQNEIEAGLNFNLKKFTIEPVFYFMFGLERMSQVDVSIERDIKLFPRSKQIQVSITPGALTSLGTPLFAYIYYEFPDPDYDYEKFRPIDFEGSLSLNIAWRNLEIIGVARYNIPFNVGNESLTPFLYFTAEINYSF